MKPLSSVLAVMLIAAPACSPKPGSVTDAEPELDRDSGEPPGDGGAAAGADAAFYYPYHTSSSLPPAPPTHYPLPLSCENVDPAGADWCPLPPSICANEEWLAYYSQPSCDAGMCAWEVDFIHCQLGCSWGGCNQSFT